MLSRIEFCTIQGKMLSLTFFLAILYLSMPTVEAFSTVPALTRCSLPDRSTSLHKHELSRLSVDNKTRDGQSANINLVNYQEGLRAAYFSLRLSMYAMLSAATLTTFIEPAMAAPLPSSGDYQEGISSVTKSALGTSVRTSVVQSAKLVDAVDLKWERFSDSLRDNKKCDPRTNRRLFDNGYRRDGTQRGNPVLGALCDPVPLKDVDNSLIQIVLDDAFDKAAFEILKEKNADPLVLRSVVDQRRGKLESEFMRPIGSQDSSQAKTATDLDQVTKRQRYNLEVYSRVRAYSEVLREVTTSSPTTATSTSKSKGFYLQQNGRRMDLLWGRNLLDRLAGPSDATYEFQSPFPKPDPDIPLPYDADKLTNALGAVEIALNILQSGGLIGHWEISIPEDDYGEVVTIAIDDDVCLGAQILAREESPSAPLTGSPVVAMVRSAIEDRAKIPYAALDVFFIDPTTTRNELYNPTQLLVSIRNLGEEP